MKIRQLTIITASLFAGLLAAETLLPNALDGESLRNRIVGIAKKYIGTRYDYGGNGESGFDCSGFVQFIYGENGIALPRTSMGQYMKGDKIDLARASAGDLVFFKIDHKTISHVGIYLEKSEFIHAPSTGKKVSVDSIEAEYWKKRFAGAATYIKSKPIPQ